METPSCKFYPQHGSSGAWKRAPPPPRASHKPWSSEHNLLLASTLSRDAIFDLLSPSLSLILQYLFGVFTFPSTLSSEGFSVRLSVSASTFIDTLQNCTGVRSPIRLHFITSFFTSPFTLSVRTSVAPAATACRVECRPDSNRVHYL